MKIYRAPEVLFQSISTKDVITTSFALERTGKDDENVLNWGQLPNDQ